MKTPLISSNTLIKAWGALCFGSALTLITASSHAQWVCEDSLPNHWGSRDLIQLQDGTLMVASTLEGANGYNVWNVRWRDPVTGLWLTVDEFQEDAGYYTVIPEGMTQAPDGSVYVAGQGYSYYSGGRKKGQQTSVESGTIRKGVFANGTWTWTTSDTASGIWYFDIAAGPNGELIAVGSAVNSGESLMIRRSIDGGTTWETISNNLDMPGRANGVSFDSAGNAFLTGVHVKSFTVEVPGKGKKTNTETVYEDWLVTLGIPAGTTQIDVLDEFRVPDTRTWGNSIAITSDGYVVTVGDAWGGTSSVEPENIVVRVLPPGAGGSWFTAGLFGTVGDKLHGNKAYSVIEGANGIVYVAGNLWNPAEQVYRPAILSTLDFANWDTEFVPITTGAGRGLSSLVVASDAFYASIYGWRNTDNQCSVVRYDLSTNP